MKKATRFFIITMAFCTFMLTKTKSMEANVTEIWKDIQGYEGLYQISNTGFVKSMDRTNHQSDGKILKLKSKSLKPAYDKKGYIRYRLSKNDVLNSFRAHRLVAIHFITNPEGKPQVNHINGIKTDNRVENLEWCTNHENTLHSWRELGRKPAEDTGKKPVYQVSLDGFFIAEYSSGNEAQRITGFKHIHDVCRGERNHAGGYRWYY